jgi:hypothetical protein
MPIAKSSRSSSLPRLSGELLTPVESGVTTSAFDHDCEGLDASHVGGT